MKINIFKKLGLLLILTQLNCCAPQIISSSKNPTDLISFLNYYHHKPNGFLNIFYLDGKIVTTNSIAKIDTGIHTLELFGSLLYYENVINGIQYPLEYIKKTYYFSTDSHLKTEYYFKPGKKYYLAIRGPIYMSISGHASDATIYGFMVKSDKGLDTGLLTIELYEIDPATPIQDDAFFARNNTKAKQYESQMNKVLKSSVYVTREEVK